MLDRTPTLARTFAPAPFFPCSPRLAQHLDARTIVAQVSRPLLVVPLLDGSDPGPPCSSVLPPVYLISLAGWLPWRALAYSPLHVARPGLAPPVGVFRLEAQARCCMFVVDQV